MNTTRLQNIVFIFSIYSIITSFLYLLGYWGQFNVNILEHIAISDMVKLAILPMFYVFLLSIVISMAGYFLAKMTIFASNLRNKPNESKVRTIDKVLYLENYVILAILSVQLMIGLFLDQTCIYLFFCFLAFSCLIKTYNESKLEFLHETLGDIKSKNIIAYILMFCITHAYLYGVFNANDVMKSDVHFKSNINNKKLTYIGLSGDYIFLWSKEDQSVTAIRKDSITEFYIPVNMKHPIFDIRHLKATPNNS